MPEAALDAPRSFPQGSNGHLLVQALEARDIPCRYLSPEEITHPRCVGGTVAAFRVNDVPYYFGSGLRVSSRRGVRVPGPLIDGRSAVFVKRKDLVETFLRDHGFSVPLGSAFRCDAQHEAESFFEAFSPSMPEGVCVKPTDGRLGRLVHAGIRDLASFRTAFAAIAQHHKRIIIEETVRGTVYRFFCLAGRVIAIRFGCPANVVGDGVHTIADLVKLKNAERRLNPVHAHYPLQLGRRARSFLSQAGLTPDDVPEAGRRVFLSNLSNLHRGAECIDVTDAVHPSYIEMVERVLSLLPGPVLCGPDVVIEDANRPATGDNYHILELNCGAGFSSHHYPWHGQPRDVAGAIIDYLVTSRPSPVGLAPFVKGSNGHYLVQALEARGIPYRYLAPEEITHPRFVGGTVAAFHINDVPYYFASGLRVSDPRGVRVPGPLIDGPNAPFVKRKDLVETFLRDHGFSVPQSASFTSDAQEEAETFFEEFSLSMPEGVCVKPADGCLGRLVHVGIRDLASFRTAFAAVAKRHKRIVVDEMVRGTVYRFFCLAGRVIAIRVGHPANVEGDGVHTVADLVSLKNAERRLNPSAYFQSRLRLGPREIAFLNQANLTPDNVREAGMTVFLSSLSNVHQGADIIDVTDAVHPSYIEVVERVLNLLPGLTLCGADVVIEDASQPATDDNYHILELNCGAGFSDHIHPWRGQPRDVAGAIIDYLVTSRAGPVDPAPFVKGSDGHCLVQALEARGIPYSYLSPGEITHPRFVGGTVAVFHINDVAYYFASGLRVSDPHGVRVPGPLIGGPSASFVKGKDLAFLRDLGFNVPAGAAFSREAQDQAEAYFEAFSPSLPAGVCVKPTDGRAGQLVYVGIRDLVSFRTAFAVVAKHHERILIEEMVRGTVYRFICLGGRVIAIRFGRPANVEGDGIHTIADLVKLKNAERRLNPGHAPHRLWLRQQECSFLSRAGLTPDDVPAAGRRVFLSPLSNLHQGADIIDATDAMHQSYVEIVERVVSHLPGPVLCGAQVVIEDASQPAIDDNYHVLELNAGADFASYHYPWQGQPRDVAGALVDYLATP